MQQNNLDEIDDDNEDSIADESEDEDDYEPIFDSDNDEQDYEDIEDEIDDDNEDSIADESEDEDDYEPIFDSDNDEQDYEDIEDEIDDDENDGRNVINRGSSKQCIKEIEELPTKAILRDDLSNDDDIEEENIVVEAEVIEPQKNNTSTIVPQNTPVYYKSHSVEKIYNKGIEVYNNTLTTYYAKENAQKDIASAELQKFYFIQNQSRFLMEQINKNGVYLWRYKDSYCFRTAKNATPSKGDKNYISEIVSNHLNKPVKIVSLKEIKKEDKITNNQIEQYVFEHDIDIVNEEVFEPREEEFFLKDGVWHRNRFLYTQYLKKRFDSINSPPNRLDCFIIDFLENITNENNQDDNGKLLTKAILSWLSYFFQKMESLHIALVLNGSKKIADIFWKRLIQKIFDSETYSIIINDDVLNLPIEEIVKDKIFFRIVDFSPTKKNIDKINQLLEAILIDKYVFSGVSGKLVKVPVYGQLLITANETISYMYEYFDLFEYVNIQNEEQVIKNLAASSSLLQLKFNDEEIDTFSTYLSFWNGNAARDSIVVISRFNPQNNNMPSTTKKEDFEDKILNFIQAIKDKNIEYFNKLENSELYSGLMFSFSKDCIIRKHLLDYFKAVNDSEVFKNNTIFLEVLKEKDELFTQEVDKLKAIDENGVEQVLFNGNPTYSDVKNEKLLKIVKYTLPKDIMVPKNFILASKSKKQRFEYEYEDIDTANMMYEKYDINQKEKKS